MKRLLTQKKFIITIIALVFLVTVKGHAQEITIDGVEFNVEAIDSETGTSIAPENIEILKTNNTNEDIFSLKGLGNNLLENKSIEAKVTLPGNTIQPFASSGQTTSKNSVTAKINVEYERNSSRKLKFSKVYGSWSVSNKLIGLHSRSVTYKNSRNYIQYKYPSGNTFNYSTGWGYESENTAGNGNASSTVASQASGMSIVYVTVTVNIPQFN